MTHGLSFDVAHMLAGLLVLVSFMMLYQVRLYALLHVLALHAFVLALSVAWQAYIQNAPHLYITAALALGFKAILIPWALRRMVRRMGIHREIETVGSIGLTMLAGIALDALSLEVMLPVTAQVDPVGGRCGDRAIGDFADLAVLDEQLDPIHEFVAARIEKAAAVEQEAGRVRHGRAPSAPGRRSSAARAAGGIGLRAASPACGSAAGRGARSW